jgi:hypothetical protein
MALATRSALAEFCPHQTTFVVFLTPSSTRRAAYWFERSFASANV